MSSFWVKQKKYSSYGKESIVYDLENASRQQHGLIHDLWVKFTLHDKYVLTCLIRKQVLYSKPLTIVIRKF